MRLSSAHAGWQRHTVSHMPHIHMYLTHTLTCPLLSASPPSRHCSPLIVSTCSCASRSSTHINTGAQHLHTLPGGRHLHTLPGARHLTPYQVHGTSTPYQIRCSVALRLCSVPLTNPYTGDYSAMAPSKFVLAVHSAARALAIVLTPTTVCRGTRAVQ